MTACTLTLSSAVSFSGVDRRNGVLRLSPALLTSRSTWTVSILDPRGDEFSPDLLGQIRAHYLHGDAISRA